MKEYPHTELSYKITGACFTVFNELGHGHLEKIYEKALALELKQKNLSFVRQLQFPIQFKEKDIGKYIFDFLIEDRIILELKRGQYFGQKNIKQVYQYLIANDIKLGIIAQFTKNGVKIKRVVNLD